MQYVFAYTVDTVSSVFRIQCPQPQSQYHFTPERGENPKIFGTICGPVASPAAVASIGIRGILNDNNYPIVIMRN